MEKNPLLDKIIHLIDSGTLDLPVFNEAAVKLQNLGASDEADAEDLEKLILGDQVLVAEILRAANSTFFCGLAQVNTIRTAIVRLGMRQVCNLAVLASQRAAYHATDRLVSQMMQQLWAHTTATAMAAGWLARRLGLAKELESQAFVGGLLHDVGKLVILRAVDEIKKIQSSRYALAPRFIDEILATAHTSVGFSFLQHWDIPAVYCEIARDHHLPDFDPAKIALVTVRLANHAGAKVGLSLEPHPDLILRSLPEAQCLNARDMLLAELTIMMEDSLSLAGG